MKKTDRIRQWGEKTEYPFWGMMLVMALLMVSPFLSGLIPYAAFVICLYRVVRYDVKVFAVDYCLLTPVSALFRTTGGMTLLIWLCLVAAIWYFIRGKIRGNSTLVFLLLLLIYLITRMQMDINDFVLCFGQVFILYVLAPRQDPRSAECAIKAFCGSVIISSIYALIFRNTSYLSSIVGYDSEAIWGSGIMRFQGLFADPNYYMTLLVVGLALLCKLKEADRLRPVSFWIQSIAMVAFGVLTYSKTFFLMLVLLIGTYIIWQFWSKKIFYGVFFTVVVMIGAVYGLSAENSPFAVVLERMTSSKDLSDFTTNRSDLFVAYLNAITKNLGTFLFGYGFNAPLLRMGAHNIYLEIAYYSGVLGLVLMVGFCISMLRWIGKRTSGFQKQNFIAKYVVLMMVAVLYFSLQGMFLVYSYAAFFLVFLSLYITKNETE